MGEVASGVPFFSPIVSWMFLLCIHHHSLVGGTGSCRLDHFCCLGVLVLRLHKGLFDGSVSFKVYLYTILTTYMFDAFCCSFHVWDDYLSYCGLVCLSVVGVLLAWLLMFILQLLSLLVLLLMMGLLLLVSSQLLLRTFCCTPFMAQVG